MREDGVRIASYETEVTLRVASATMGSLFSIVLVLVIIEQQTGADIVGTFVVASTMWTLFMWLPFVARVDLFADRLELVNPWGTVLIPVGQVERLWGKQFLTIRTHDGRQRIAWAVQGANITVAQGRETRAGRVARELTQAIEQLPPVDGAIEQASWRFPAPPWFFVAGEILFVLIAVVAFARM